MQYSRVLYPSDGIASFACLFSRSIGNRKRVDHAYTIDPKYTALCYTRSTLAICGSRMKTAVPQGYTQSLFDFMPKSVTVVIAINVGYTDY
ncbi:hypothetical protein TNCV_2756301 [Trichonephila clavipes]|nr:hypothetical protein TNCV_2756301 [Trichonephila clavipes]